MDVGGSDAPLDEALLPFLTLIAPNESELSFISGVETRGATGAPSKEAVRTAVGSLKRLCAECGNRGVEVLVTLGELGSIHFASDWRHEDSAEVRACARACACAHASP